MDLSPSLISSLVKISLFTSFKGKIPFAFRQKSYGSYFSLSFIHVIKRLCIIFSICFVYNLSIFSSNSLFSSSLLYAPPPPKSPNKSPFETFLVPVKLFLKLDQNSSEGLSSFGFILKK